MILEKEKEKEKEKRSVEVILTKVMSVMRGLERDPPHEMVYLRNQR